MKVGAEFTRNRQGCQRFGANSSLAFPIGDAAPFFWREPFASRAFEFNTSAFGLIDPLH
jgi:hypothetical protein